MDVLKIPFNEFVGLTTSDDSRYLLELDARPEYLNHIGTVHASALFALAEASSGVFLLKTFEAVEVIVPVVRNVEIKYKKPAHGMIRSTATLIDTGAVDILEKLERKSRTLLSVKVSLLDSRGVNVMQATFEWFVTKITKEQIS